MGNSYFGVNDQRLRQAEIDVASYGYMTREQLHIQNIDINQQLADVQLEYNEFYDKEMSRLEVSRNTLYKDSWIDLPYSADMDTRVQHTKRELWEHGHEQNYIHQIDFSCSDLSYEEDLKQENRNEKPRALFVHGFGGTGMAFYRMVDLLRHQFRITTIDLLGMGASGRPPFNLRSSRDCVEFFTRSIEAWIRHQKIDEKFILFGHSLGGYISTHFSLRYPERVSKLILLSPVGIPEPTKGQSTIRDLLDMEETKKGKIMIKIAGRMNNKNVSPIMFLKVGGKKGCGKIADSWMKNWTALQDQKEMNTFKTLI